MKTLFKKIKEKIKKIFDWIKEHKYIFLLVLLYFIKVLYNKHLMNKKEESVIQYRWVGKNNSVSNWYTVKRYVTIDEDNEIFNRTYNGENLESVLKDLDLI